MLLSQVMNITSTFPLRHFIIRSQQWQGNCFMPPLLWVSASRSALLSRADCSSHSSETCGGGQMPSAMNCSVALGTKSLLGMSSSLRVLQGRCIVSLGKWISKSLTGLDDNRRMILLESRNLSNSTQLSIIRANLALSSTLRGNISKCEGTK